MTILAALAAFDTVDAGRLNASENRLMLLRRVDADNQALVAGMADEQAGLRSYLEALTLGPGTPRGAADREYLLAQYFQGAGEVAVTLNRLRSESGQAGLGPQEGDAEKAALAWQAWAQASRAAAEQSHGQPIDPALAAQGPRLFDRFTAADQAFKDETRRASAAAAAQVETQSANHVRLFLAGVAVEALVLLLLAAALMRSVLMPMRRLTETAAMLARGDNPTVPFSSRADEVGSLARALTAWRQAAADRASVFERSPIGICRISTAGTVLESNPSFDRMLGYGAGELTGRAYADLIEPSASDLMAGIEAELVAGRQDRLSRELRYLRRDGTSFWGNLTVAAVHAGDESVDYVVAMIEDIDARKRQELELRFKAAHDPLTKLPNRAALHERLDQAIRRARRGGGELAVIVMDLDRFKPVNDQFGHQAGDQLLRQVARRLQACLRESDVVARLGGDEFAIVLGDDGAAGAATAAAKVRQAFEAPFRVGDHQPVVGVSLGVAVFPHDGVDAAALLQHADAAMYDVKRSRPEERAAG